MFNSIILAATLFTSSVGGIDVEATSNNPKIDLGSSTRLELKISVSKDVEVELPNLRERSRGFSSVEEIVHEPYEIGDKRIYTSSWHLLPQPCAKEYKIAPFLIKTKCGTSIVAGPIKFDAPDERAHVEGGMEVDPVKDKPPFQWKNIWRYLFYALVVLLLCLLIYFIVKYIISQVRIYRLSPSDRALREIARLVKKNFPQQGKFKTFYIELTMVVRRYIQRKYGVNAPYLTTDEFLKQVHKSQDVSNMAIDDLIDFLEKADLIKFAGVNATVDTAAEAVESAKSFIKADNNMSKYKKNK